jgi:AhpD family alkylhydroperoxidase
MRWRPTARRRCSASTNYILHEAALPEELIHLVFLRVSQINGCAHCIDIHSRDLLKTMAADR